MGQAQARTGGETSKVAYRVAIAEAIGDAMARDDKVVLMGEDIGESGGPLATTQGLYERFGAARVRDTPISESGFLGAALGLAIAGYRPIVEIMFADFLATCFDHLVNSIAKHRFMSGGTMRAPLVVRAMGGGGLSFGAQHSQTCESWLLSVEGLRIVCPSNAAEAYGMLSAAIKHEDPVLVIEHKALLGQKGIVDPSDMAYQNLYEPAVRREGTDVTLVASLAMVQRALEAAEKLEQEGISAEVIDLRVLKPYDGTVVRDSVRKTGRLVTIEEQCVDGGWGSMVVADTVANALDFFDAPPIRMGLSPGLHPYSPPLEALTIPTPDTIADVVRGLDR